MKCIIGKQISFVSRVIQYPRLPPVVVHKKGEIIKRTWNTLTIAVKDEPPVYLPVHFYKNELTTSDIQNEIWTFVKK
jgi:hypothetical protein